MSKVDTEKLDLVIKYFKEKYIGKEKPQVFFDKSSLKKDEIETIINNKGMILSYCYIYDYYELLGLSSNQERKYIKDFLKDFNNKKKK